MLKAKEPATAQLGLFPTTTPIPQLSREIKPKIVTLLARLLRQYAEREAASADRSGAPKKGAGLLTGMLR